MPTTHIALIRGINVGRAKRVAMADLRGMVGTLGYSDVRTVLNSGNVIFTNPVDAPVESAARIEESLESQLGVSARVVVLTAPELSVIVRDNPLLEAAENPSRLIVAVPTRSGDCFQLMPLTEREWTPEILALGDRVAYLWCPEGVLASRLPEAVARAVGDAVTTRNWRTIMKIEAIVHENT